MYVYLQDTDFNVYLSDVDATTLSVSIREFSELAESLALAEVRQALYAFDLSKEFYPWQAYLPGVAYLNGNRVIADFQPYYAIQDVGPDVSISDTSYWVQGDSRLPQLLNVVIRLTIYYLASRMSIGTLPPSLADHATEARNWLKDQASGVSPALLPRLDSTNSLPYGSNVALSDGGTIWQ